MQFRARRHNLFFPSFPLQMVSRAKEFHGMNGKKKARTHFSARNGLSPRNFLVSGGLSPDNFPWWKKKWKQQVNRKFYQHRVWWGDIKKDSRQSHCGHCQENPQKRRTEASVTFVFSRPFHRMKQKQQQQQQQHCGSKKSQPMSEMAVSFWVLLCQGKKREKNALCNSPEKKRFSVGRESFFQKKNSCK